MLDHVERKLEVTENFEKQFPMDCNMPYKIKLVTPFFVAEIWSRKTRKVFGALLTLLQTVSSYSLMSFRPFQSVIVEF